MTIDRYKSLIYRNVNDREMAIAPMGITYEWGRCYGIVDNSSIYLRVKLSILEA